MHGQSVLASYLGAMPNPPNTRCPICEQESRKAGNAILETADGDVETQVRFCGGCDVFHRVARARDLDDHFRIASYVRLDRERSWRAHRQGFFDRVLDAIDALPRPRSSGNPRVLVDYGCSYGHLIEMARDRGYDARGVEPNQALVDLCRDRGQRVEPNLDGFEDSVDVVALIDSLYYVPNPRFVLEQIRNVLQPEGWIVARLTNRNAITRLMNRLRSEPRFDLLGDAVVSYSVSGAVRLFESCDFRVDQVKPDSGWGKRLSLGRTVAYKAAAAASSLLPRTRMLAPGFFVYAQRRL